MKRKENLSEELYNMRKLMNFNSEKFKSETTSLDRLVEEKMVKKYLINEQEVSDKVKSHPYYNYLIDMVGDKSRGYWTGKYGADNKRDGVKMTDEDRLKILNSVQQKVVKSARINDISEDKAKKKFEKISIFTGKSGKEEIPANPDEVSFEFYTGVYPDVENPNDQLSNFYLTDNEISVGEKQKEGFDVMVKSLLKLIGENDEKIVGVKIRVGSSTSKVPTTYSGGEYSSIEEGQKNNVPLVEDRGSEIEKVLKEIIIDNISEDTYSGGIEVVDAQLTPNNGTDYTSKEKKHFFSEFGKLDPAKKDEYEKMYGPYKGSYGSVTIITEGAIKDGDEFDPDVIISQEWGVRMVLKGLKRGKKKKRFGNPGGGKSYVGMKAPLDCEFWMKRQ